VNEEEIREESIITRFTATKHVEKKRSKRAVSYVVLETEYSRELGGKKRQGRSQSGERTPQGSSRWLKTGRSSSRIEGKI